MKAWSMFVHSVRLVLNNLGVALRISLLLYLVQVAGQVYGNSIGIYELQLEAGGLPVSNVTGGQQAIFLLLNICAVVASLWIAVAWHRYVLLSEMPNGWLPVWPGGKVFGYLGRSLLIGLAIMLVAVPVTIVVGSVGLPILTIGAAVGVAAYIFFRLSPILPAIALGEDMKFRQALKATSDNSSTLFGLAGLTVAGTLILQLPTILSGDPGSSLSVVYSVVVGWFATMIGVSLLTTVYGHFVESRDIG